MANQEPWLLEHLSWRHFAIVMGKKLMKLRNQSWQQNLLKKKLCVFVWQDQITYREKTRHFNEDGLEIILGNIADNNKECSNHFSS